jgi:hypothetical protein
MASPPRTDIAGFGFSGTAPEWPKANAATPIIEVSIRHGNLTYARHPVLVGHYQGDTVVSAEAVLDRQLCGHLTRRLDLGIYPGPLGSHTVFLNDSPPPSRWVPSSSASARSAGSAPACSNPRCAQRCSTLR